MSSNVNLNKPFGWPGLRALQQAEGPYSLAQFAQAIIQKIPYFPQRDQNHNWARKEVTMLILELPDNALEDISQIVGNEEVIRVRSTARAIQEMKARIDKLAQNGILHEESKPSLLSFGDSLFDEELIALDFETQLIVSLFHSFKAQGFEDAKRILCTFFQVMVWFEKNFIPHVKTTLLESQPDELTISHFVLSLTREYRKYIPEWAAEPAIEEVNRSMIEQTREHIEMFNRLASERRALNSSDDEKEGDNEGSQSSRDPLNEFMRIYQGVWKRNVNISFLPKDKNFLIETFVKRFMEYLDVRFEIELSAAHFIERADLEKNQEETVEEKAAQLVGAEQGMSDEDRRILLSAIQTYLLKRQEAPEADLEDVQMEIEPAETDLEKTVKLLTTVLEAGKEKDALLSPICDKMIDMIGASGNSRWQLSIVTQILPHIQNSTLRADLFKRSAWLYNSIGSESIVLLGQEFPSFNLESKTLLAFIKSFNIEAGDDEEEIKAFVNATKEHLFEFLSDEDKEVASEKLDQYLGE